MIEQQVVPFLQVEMLKDPNFPQEIQTLAQQIKQVINSSRLGWAIITLVCQILATLERNPTTPMSSIMLGFAQIIESSRFPLSIKSLNQTYKILSDNW